MGETEGVSLNRGTTLVAPALVGELKGYIPMRGAVAVATTPLL